MSLCASGTPCRAPRFSPLASAASASSAAFNALSASIAIKALSLAAIARFGAGRIWSPHARKPVLPRSPWQSRPATSGPARCSSRHLHGLSEQEARRLEIERQGAGDRGKAFEGRADRIGDPGGHLGVDRHAGAICHGPYVLRTWCTHSASLPLGPSVIAGLDPPAGPKPFRRGEGPAIHQLRQKFSY